MLPIRHSSCHWFNYVGNAQGVPHGVQCQDVISPSYDCGASLLLLSSCFRVAAVPRLNQYIFVPLSWGRFLLSGRTTLAITGQSASVARVQLRTNLVAGNDPLRPNVSVPALPAWLKGITDEVGFLSPDLGVFQL